MRFSKGLHRDNHPHTQPPDTYVDMINGVFKHQNHVINNEKGNKLSGTLSGKIPIGKIALLANDTVIFSVDPTNGVSEVGLYKNDSYTVILNDSGITDDDKLKFNVDFPIEGDFRLNNQLETIIYWTDNLNKPRVLNIDKPGSDPFGTSLNLFPELLDIPDITLSSVALVGGVLLSGAYQYAFAYLQSDDTPTNYFYVSNPVYLNDEQSFSPVQEFDGAENNTATTRSVTINLNNIDNINFTKIRVAVIKDGTVSLLEDINITGTSMNIIHSGGEITEPSSLDAIIIGNASYDRVKTIKQMDGYLFMGNLGGGLTEDIGYQRYANGIKTYMVEETYVDFLDSLGGGGHAESEALYKNSEISFNKKTFRRGEVYAFYISFVLKNGNESVAYHIPGRQSVPTDRAFIGLLNPNIARISSITGTPLGEVESWKFEHAPDATYNMAFWENENEQYLTPENDSKNDFEIWEVVGGLGVPTGNRLSGKVRHHRFPSFHYSKFYDGLNINNEAKIVGVRFENIQIPNEIKDQILGYKIYYAERTPANRTIMDQAINIGVTNYTIDDDDPYISIGMGAHSTSPDVYKNIAVFHPFTGLRNKSINQISYIERIAKLSDSPLLTPNDLISGAFYVHQTLNVVFLPNHVDRILTQALGFDFDFKQNDGESKFLIRVDGDMESSGTTGDPFNSMWNLRIYREDLYLNFGSQSLIFTGYMDSDIDDPISGSVFGGDTYISMYAFKSHAQHLTDDQIFIHYSVFESDDNIGYRHEGEEIFQEYYPRTPFSEFNDEDEEIGGQTRLDIDNYFGYNALGYSLLNKIKPSFPSINANKATFRYPTRILRSKKDDGNNEGDPFRDFSDQDFRDLPKNRGELIKLQHFNRSLIAHFERGLMRTKGREELLVGDSRAFVGSGDILSVEPDELVVTDDGFGGLQFPQTSIVTPAGYFFVDAQAGKIFLFGYEGLEEISSYGMTEFFKRNLRKNLVHDFGFKESEAEYPLYKMTAIYDNENDRIIFTKRDWGFIDESLFKKGIIRWSNGSYQIRIPVGASFQWRNLSINNITAFKEKSFTISYYPKIKAWISFHSYIPTFYFSNISNFYSILQNGDIYKHGAFDSKYGRFYDSLYNFEMEFIENTPIGVSKQAVSLGFDTRIEDSLGVEHLNKTFTSVRIKNGYQDSGEVIVKPFNTDGYNARRTKRVWHINKFRDILVVPSDTSHPRPHLYKKRLQDNYHSVRLIYGNQDNYSLYLFNAFLNTKIPHR